MPMLPHNFPALRNVGGNYRPSVIIVGAGMSFGLVPGPGKLLAEKRTKGEAALGYNSAIPFDPWPPADHLYKWADEIITKLNADGNPNPKLTLAQALDIPSESRWLGCLATQRNLPRHRVIARFAREEMWEQVWSLNWDCVQESAFENVGVKRNSPDANLPWPTTFKTFITAADCAEMGVPHIVKVVKPHGCVMALVEAETLEKSGNHPAALQKAERFLITETELNGLNPLPGRDGTQHYIFASLSAELSAHPFVVAGWSVGEPYLLNHINNYVRPTFDLRHPLPKDELSIIDIQFNPNGHTQLAGFYGMNQATAHIPVNTADFSTDSFFLWLQALYAVDCLKLCVLPADQGALNDLSNQLQAPPNAPSFAIPWADNFLPVWTRLCWRCGLIKGRNRINQQINVDQIHLESRDEHIPWRYFETERFELVAAARLLAALHQSGDAIAWDYEMFPGGLYRDNHLVIPLPAWAGATMNDLQGLKALIDAIKQPGAGYIDQLSILFLTQDAADAVPDDKKRVIKELVARNLSMARFARGDDIQEFNLGDF